MPSSRSTPRILLRRLDAAARKLNLVLVIIAIGLGVLNLTVIVSLKALDRIPITRVVCE